MAEAPLAHAPRETIEAFVREAARAPSAHNVQPARWRFEPGGDVVLFRALDRTLPVSDPTGHDIQASLGAAFEGMAIALSRLAFTLRAPVPEHAAQAEGCEPVARARIVGSAKLDPLAHAVMKRRCYRGSFTRRGARELAAARTVEAADVQVLDDQLDNYHAELWKWLRLSRRDPRYRRDGLNADCLALSSTQRVAARVLLRPSVFSQLTRLRVARPLISEAAQVRSAIALVLFMPRRTDSPFEVGRRFYRLWLELTAAGLYAAPMSASADDTKTRARYEEHVTSDRRLANVLRVGHAPEGLVAESHRLPTAELLV